MFKFSFKIADVKTPILGADFLCQHELVLDMSKKLLSGSAGKICLKTLMTHSKMATINFAQSEFENITRKYKLNEQYNVQDIKHSVEHHIDTISQAPLFSRARAIPQDRLAEVKAVFKTMLDQGIIRRSNSQWSSPLHLVKKPDGTWRPCGDYRRLNDITVPDRYTIPRIQDVTSILHGTTIYSKLDLVKAYFQVPMAANDIKKTALCTPFGTFEFLRMPFGLRNATQSFQRLIDNVLGDLNFVFAYLDDILIASKSKSQHAKHIKIVCERLSLAGLKLNVQKSVFGQTNVKFLGHQITAEGIQPLPEKVQAIVTMPRPNTVEALLKFLGMSTFYMRFIPRLADVLQPLHKVDKTKKKALISWLPVMETAYEKAKLLIANAVKLGYPSKTGTISLLVDASGTGIGATLQQMQKQVLTPLAFFSKKFTERERKDSTFDRELVAIYEAIKHFRYFLEGREFTIFTDHKPIVQALHKATDALTAKQQRQLAFIAEYTSDLRHISGSQNLTADYLSRHINKITQPLRWFDIANEQKRMSTEELKHFQVHELKRGSVTLLAHDNRIIVPKKFTKTIFDVLHNTSHPSSRATGKLIRQSYIWYNIGKDITNWSRTCPQCQEAKISRYVKTNPEQIPVPLWKFEHVHMDLVGPLPQSDGCTYILTIIDRASRWPVAIPLKGIKTRDILEALKWHWISLYGLPLQITTDQGCQFTSVEFKSFFEQHGVQIIHASTYHPQGNGLIERFHRTLKTALRTHDNKKWTELLPWIMLSLRANFKGSIETSPAELVFKQQLRLPGQFNLSGQKTTRHPTTHNSEIDTFLPKGFQEASHMLVKRDPKRKRTLNTPFHGPYRILERRKFTCLLEIKKKPVPVHVSRLKPFFMEGEAV